MVLRRDAPVSVDLDVAVVGPVRHRRAEAAVRLPRVPDAVRAAGGGAQRSHRAVAPGRRPGARGRGSPGSTTAPAAAAALAGPAELDVAAAWAGRAGPLGADRSGRRASTPTTRRWDGCRRPSSTDPAVQAALIDGRPVRAHQAKALMRGLAVLGIDLRSLAARHGHRRLPDRPGREPLRHRRPPGPLHGRLVPGRGHARGPARPRRRRRRRAVATARHRARRQPPGAGAAGRARQAGHAGALRRRSRTRSSPCWPAWRRRASASTPSSCAG